jgi:hypothetical protein
VVALTVSNLGKELPHRRRLDERVEDERVEDEPEDAELD